MAHDLKKKWRTKDVQLQEKADFSVMLLSDRVLSGLTKAGFKTPSPIQLEAIPIGRFGKDLLVQAKSGTGKTLVFTIVALEMLKPKLFRPQVLILAPTREIAAQICSVIKSVGSSFHKLTCFSFIGGLPVVEDKERALTCQIAVGTPGRVRQLITLGSMPTNSIRLLVFDEADELLQGTFKLELDEIFKSLPKDKQVIATSATYPPRLRKIIFQYLKDPFIACLNATDLALLGIVHYTKVVNSSLMPLLEYKNKLAALEQLLTKLKFCQCLVFCNMISRVEVLCKDIKKWGFSTAYISSAKEQSERLKAIDRLKHFKCKVLVSSDVTSRGIDAENVDLVINFDLAITTETYLHRVGRAGRYGSIGLAVTILTEKQLLSLKKIEQEAAFKSHKLPEPLPKDLIRNPYIGEYTFEVEEPAQGMGEGNVQPVVCNDEMESIDMSPNDGTLKENYSVELRHGTIEKAAKNLVESASESSCERLNTCYAGNDSVPTENGSLTIVPELEKIDPKMKSISLIKDNIYDMDETNDTNMDVYTKDSSDKDTLSNDKIYIKDLETKKVSLSKDNKPLDVIQIWKDIKEVLNPEMENSISSVEVSKVTKLNPDLNNCTEDLIIKDGNCNYEKCPKTNEVYMDEICNIPEISSTGNVNKKLDDILDGTIQSFKKKLDDLIDGTIQSLQVDEKGSELNSEKSLATVENDADDNLSQLNFTIQNYILNYENKLLQNEFEICSNVPLYDSGVSSGMIKNLMSEKRDYIYSVFKEYEKNNSSLQAAKVKLATNEIALNMNFKPLSDDRSSDLNTECKKIGPESFSNPQEVDNISKDQSEEKVSVCDQKINAGLESVRTIKDKEICDKIGKQIIFKPLDSSDDEFQDNHHINKLFQSTPYIDNRFSLNEVTKDIRICGESSSEDSDSDTISSPSHSCAIDADVPCNKKFSTRSSSDSESDSVSSCDISSSERGAKFRKNIKISPKHEDQPKGLFGLCVPKNFESRYSDFNPLPQSRCKKLPSKDFNTGRFFREQRQDCLNTQSEYSLHQIPKNPNRCNFDHDSIPWSHHCQLVSHQHYTGHWPQTACKPRYGRRGNHLPLRCQKAEKSFELHHTQGTTSCCASSECNCHPLSNATSDGHCRHVSPCCSSSAAYINPYDIFYQQWQYLQRCMNAPF